MSFKFYMPRDWDMYGNHLKLLHMIQLTHVYAGLDLELGQEVHKFSAVPAVLTQ